MQNNLSRVVWMQNRSSLTLGPSGLSGSSEPWILSPVSMWIDLNLAASIHNRIHLVTTQSFWAEVKVKRKSDCETKSLNSLHPMHNSGQEFMQPLDLTWSSPDPFLKDNRGLTLMPSEMLCCAQEMRGCKAKGTEMPSWCHKTGLSQASKMLWYQFVRGNKAQMSAAAHYYVLRSLFLFWQAAR